MASSADQTSIMQVSLVWEKDFKMMRVHMVL